jgi:hypothetical protein
MRPLHVREQIRNQIERLDLGKKILKPGAMLDLMELVNPIEQKINKEVGFEF